MTGRGGWFVAGVAVAGSTWLVVAAHGWVFDLGLAVAAVVVSCVLELVAAETQVRRLVRDGVDPLLAGEVVVLARAGRARWKARLLEPVRRGWLARW